MTDKVIECRDVWKLFGGRAGEVLAAMRGQGLGKAEVLQHFDCA